jgi:hypothetical protein
MKIIGSLFNSTITLLFKRNELLAADLVIARQSSRNRCADLESVLPSHKVERLILAGVSIAWGVQSDRARRPR